jgi:hypothetical protein
MYDNDFKNCHKAEPSHRQLLTQAARQLSAHFNRQGWNDKDHLELLEKKIFHKIHQLRKKIPQVDQEHSPGNLPSNPQELFRGSSGQSHQEILYSTLRTIFPEVSYTTLQAISGPNPEVWRWRWVDFLNQHNPDVSTNDNIGRSDMGFSFN